MRFGTFVGKSKGILFNGELEQSTMYSPLSHQHSSGHISATQSSRIANHYQNKTVGTANSSDTNTTVLMAWRAAVISRGRGTDRELYCAFYEDVLKDSTRTL